VTVAARIETPPSEGVRSSPENDIRAALARYEGHPYATAAALNLLADGAPIADLPADPTPTGVATAQWRRLCDEHKENAIKILEAYAILEVPVPDEVVDAVSGVDATARKALTANAFVAGLLHTEPDGTRIYHSLFADHIRAQISDPEAKTYHTRAIEIYRHRLTADTKPDALATIRLLEHVLAVEGPQGFVDSFAGECFRPLYKLGLLDAALALSHRALEQFVSPGSEEEAMIAENLAIVFQTRGDLDEAEKLHRTSLEIAKKLGLLEGMATIYGNLGEIFHTHGDLNEAQKVLRKAMEINEKLGRLDLMAVNYGNLGRILETPGELDEAEKMHRRALDINKKLGRLEGMSNNYGNLGGIFLRRGALDDAENMLRKALEINEKLGQFEGMGVNYGNLGNIFQMRGDLDGAERMYRKALAIDEQLERLEGMANQYGNMGLILGAHGDLGGAEKMHRKALVLNEQLGRLEGMADNYGNLGGIFQTRGDEDEAERMYGRVLEIDEKLGRLDSMAAAYCNLEIIRKTRGELDEARKLWTRARDLYSKIGMPHKVEQLTRWLDDLPDTGEDRS